MRCWNYDGRLDRDGYGRAAKGLVHRLSYEALVGPIPEGLELDHLCQNRACYNPAHLEPVAHAENMRRSAERRVSGPVRGRRHGTIGAYNNQGCRCTACRATWAQYKRSYKQRQKVAA